MADHHDPYLGKLINDRFRVLELVARGDTSRIYKAEQTPLGRTVALKILDASYNDTDDPRFAQRFFLEASVASKLGHPNTVSVFDYGRTEDGTYFIAMEFVEGESLRTVLRRERHFQPASVAAIAIQIARSAREAHKLEVVHRDLRPANVLLTRHGADELGVKVLGFGLVKPLGQSGPELTQTGVFLGSPRYMSPEHIRGEPLDGRADIYSLGVLMYELLMGCVPFERPTAVKVLMAHMHEPVPPIRAADVPEALAQLIYDCLEKRPEDRPASMDVVIARLKTMASTFGGARHPVLRSSVSVAPVRIAEPSAAAPRGSLRHAHSAAARRRSLHSKPPRRVKWLRTALVMACVAAAAVLGLLGRERDASGGSQNTARQASSTAPDDGTSLPSAELPGSTFVHISSDPAGAQVEIDGKHYGPTPVLIELTGPRARQGQSLTFVLRLPGYEPARVTRTIRARRIEVHAALTEAVSGEARE